MEAARRLGRQLVPARDVDDLVSEAFAKVLAVLQRGGGPDLAFRAYLLTAVRRLHVDRIRAASRLHDHRRPRAVRPGRAVPRHRRRGLRERRRRPRVRLAARALAAGAVAHRGRGPEARRRRPAARDERQLGVRARLPRPRGAAPGVPHRCTSSELEDDACRWTREHLGAYVRNGVSRRDAAKVEDAPRASAAGARRSTSSSTEVNSNLAGPPRAAAARRGRGGVPRVCRLRGLRRACWPLLGPGARPGAGARTRSPPRSRWSRRRAPSSCGGLFLGLQEPGPGPPPAPEARGPRRRPRRPAREPQTGRRPGRSAATAAPARSRLLAPAAGGSTQPVRPGPPGRRARRPGRCRAGRDRSRRRHQRPSPRRPARPGADAGATARADSDPTAARPRPSSAPLAPREPSRPDQRRGWPRPSRGPRAPGPTAAATTDGHLDGLGDRERRLPTTSVTVRRSGRPYRPPASGAVRPGRAACRGTRRRSSSRSGPAGSRPSGITVHRPHGDR